MANYLDDSQIEAGLAKGLITPEQAAQMGYQAQMPVSQPAASGGASGTWDAPAPAPAATSSSSASSGWEAPIQQTSAPVPTWQLAEEEIALKNEADKVGKENATYDLAEQKRVEILEEKTRDRAKKSDDYQTLLKAKSQMTPAEVATSGIDRKLSSMRSELDGFDREIDTLKGQAPTASGEFAVQAPRPASQPVIQNVFTDMKVGGGASTEGYDVKQKATMAEVINQQTALNEDKKMYQDSLAEQAKIDQEFQLKQDAITAKYNDTMGKIDKLTADIAANPIDQTKYWADKSTGTKILALLSVGLGGYSAGYSGGKNRALDMIKSAIDRDVEKQAAMLKSKQGDLTNLQSLLGDYYKELNDLPSAKAALKSAQLTATIKQAELFANQTKDATKKNEALALIGELENQRQNAIIDLKGKTEVNLANWDGSYNIPIEKLPADLRPLVIQPSTGYYGVVQSLDEGKGFREKTVAVRKSQDLIKGLQEIAKTGGKSLSPELRANALMLSSMLQGSLKTELVGTGAVTDTEWELLRSVAVNPSKFWSLDNTNKSQLDKLYSKLSTGLDIVAETYGLKKVNDARNRRNFAEPINE